MDPELFHRMQEAARRFRSGESDYEEIMTPNGLARIVRDASDPRGFRIDFVGDGAKRSVPVQRYPPSPVRPPGWPAPLPFLEGCVAIVDTRSGSVTWQDPPRPGEAFERVLEQCVENGWEPVVSAKDQAAAMPAEGAASGGRAQERTRVLTRAGAERTLRLTSAGGACEVVLTERQAGTR
ncbi:MAG TPA: hypothetical protein VFQ22_12660 [Longimicrobiales bacterium]|nr:hypothetical protein [Longimicrobiales bacterium]